jgi:hypothetical protein
LTFCELAQKSPYALDMDKDSIKEPFAIFLELSELDPSPAPNWQKAFEAAAGKGKFGSAVRATWCRPAGRRLPTVVKLIIGPSPSSGAAPHAMIRHELDSLYNIRMRIDDPFGKSVAAKAGLRHLCVVYGAGSVSSAAAVLPGVAKAPDTPLYYVAMEPLNGGLLWDRLGLPPRQSSPSLPSGVRLAGPSDPCFVVHLSPIPMLCRPALLCPTLRCAGRAAAATPGHWASRARREPLCGCRCAPRHATYARRSERGQRHVPRM